MTLTHLDDGYFDRMARATAEKTVLIDHLVPGTVADVGAGGGQLAHRMSQEPGIDHVWAIDRSVDAVRRLNEFSSFDTLYGSTERLACIAPVDNVVFSSVLHEIYSYAPLMEDSAAWRTAIGHAADALAPGGRLIVRDFVVPDSRYEFVTLVAPDAEADRLLQDYLERVPAQFGNRNFIRQESKDSRTYSATREAVAEALLTMSWGMGSLARESQEKYGLETLDGYAEAVLHRRRDQLRLVHASSEIQPGYAEAMASWRCTDDRGNLWFPDTKAIWVFEKSKP